MIKIIENFLPDRLQTELELIFLNSDFPWYLNKETVTETKFLNKKSFDANQFCHTFYSDGKFNSGYWNCLIALCNKLAIDEKINTFNLYRVKANLSHPVVNIPVDSYKPPHVDIYSDNCITAIYYVNDSDGDTLFFDDYRNIKDYNTMAITKQYTPKKGTLIYFNSNILHTSKFPIKNNLRCVINFNFFQ